MYIETARRTMNPYARHSAAVQVAAAGPHELITLLFEAIDEQIAIAIGSLGSGDTERRGAAVNKAILLLQEGLRGGLDLERGGELAQRLDALYSYCATRLAEAHAKRDHAAFVEVRDHLRTVAEGWKAIRPQ